MIEFKERNEQKIMKTFIRIIIFFVLSLPVIGILATRYMPQKGFIDLVMFGQMFAENRLPEINKMDPPTHREWGNDGQFYVQLAIDPWFNRTDEMKRALDNPVFRARRIGLPMLANLLGGGSPTIVVQVYSLLNVFFWILVLISLYSLNHFRDKKDILLAVSLLWTTGTLTSIARGLTDLPAITLILLAVILESYWLIAAFLFSYAAITKETSLFSFIALVWPINKKILKNKQLIISTLLIFVPILLWFFYINNKFGGGTSLGVNAFSVPFLGIAEKIKKAFDLFIVSVTNPSPWPMYRVFHFFDFIAPFSIFFQSIYLLHKPQTNSNFWRIGFGFALLVFFLGSSVWNDQYAYTRVLLPLTFSFNFVLHEFEKNPRYIFWFMLGNIGLLWGLFDLIREIISR